jgi:hypothetical protein
MGEQVYFWVLLLVLSAIYSRTCSAIGGSSRGQSHDLGVVHEELWSLLPAFYDEGFVPQGSEDKRLYGTTKAQEAIHKHQNPESCKGKKFLVLSQGVYEVGFGAVMYRMAGALAWALNEDRIFLWGEDWGRHWSHGPFCGAQRTLDCFLLPASSCTLADAERSTDTLRANVYDSEGKLYWERADQFAKLPGNEDASQFLFWWQSQASAYLLRLNARTSSFLKTARMSAALSGIAPLPLPDNAVSIAVRGGDKAAEAELYSFEAHLEAATRLAEMRHFDDRFAVILAMDLDTIDEAGRSPDWSTAYLPRHFVREDSSSIRSSAQSDILVLEVLADLYLCLETSHFVGTRSSNFHRLIDGLRRVWPAHSVGWNSPYIDIGCEHGDAANIWWCLSEEWGSESY